MTKSSGIIKTYTKASLILELKKIRKMGWIENRRHGNHGGVGNTIEDILGIEENNLPIPNAAEWELKCQKNTRGKGSLTTLLHCEPSPTALKFVPCILLPKYGWKHKEAGKKYSKNEMSFRQTISCLNYSDRGFRVELDNKQERIQISFNAKKIHERHTVWLKSVEKRTGLTELNPQPYWGFNDIYHKLGSKLHNCFYIKAEAKIENNKEYFKYDKIYKLSGLSLERFLKCFEDGLILVDFDARTGHNHGTKFRFRNNQLPALYENVEEI